MNFWMTLIREIFRGKSLLRSVENLAFTQVRVSGKILDVAGGGRKRRPSYRRFIQSSPDSEWTMADYDQTSRPDLCFDANRCWPIADESFDTVMIIKLFLESIFTLPGKVDTARAIFLFLFSIIYLRNQTTSKQMETSRRQNEE
jgi:hypothetical protein